MNAPKNATPLIEAERPRPWLRNVALSSCVVSALACVGTPDDGFESSSQPEATSPVARPTLVQALRTGKTYGYKPKQIRRAYGFDKLSGDGTGQTIGIIDACGSSTVQNDLNEFSTKYSLAAPKLDIYDFKGPACSGWAAEIELDVEWAHAIAPGATLLLVISKSTQVTDLLDAVDYAREQGARQISMSWGAKEFSSETTYDSHFDYAGYAFFAAVGDTGHGTLWPSVSPDVVAVGGTTLDLDRKGKVLSQTAWSDTGGGASSYEKRPAYQNGWQSSTYREVPDVAYVADPSTGVSFYCSNTTDGSCPGTDPWLIAGGTSVGSPQLAAMMAIVNEGRTTYLTSPLTDIYADAGTAPNIDAAEFDDITSGCDGTGDCAAKGFDAVSGLGAPECSGLVPSLQKN